MRAKLDQVKIKVKIQTVEGVKVVNSIDLYKASGLKKQNYTRWMMYTVFPLGNLGTDYFPAPDNIERKAISVFIKHKLRYYLEIEFAMILCAVIRRKEAIQLKEFLKTNK